MERLIYDCKDLEVNKIYKLHKKESGSIYKQIGKIFRLTTIDKRGDGIKFCFVPTTFSGHKRLNTIEFCAKEYKKKWVVTKK